MKQRANRGIQSRTSQPRKIRTQLKIFFSAFGFDYSVVDRYGAEGTAENVGIPSYKT